MQKVINLWKTVKKCHKLLTKSYKNVNLNDKESQHSVKKTQKYIFRWQKVTKSDKPFLWGVLRFVGFVYVCSCVLFNVAS